MKKIKTIGLVLSGGGFRGVVHAGVIHGLEELGIQATHVAGASIGAVVGGMYAAGMNGELIRDMLAQTKLFSRHNLAFRWSGLLNANKIVEPILPYFTDDTFTALTKKLYVSRTNLETGASEIVSSGSVLDAMKSSAALPLLFAPVECGDNIYVDGGLTDNFPVQVIRADCDVVIGVSANPAQFRKRDDLHSLFSLLDQVMEISVSQTAVDKFGQCDVMIIPDGLRAYSLLDIKNADALFELGYQTVLGRRGELLRLVGTGVPDNV
ncbi:patatin-like phospholipase family protein [Neolewinella antarctica]|uniref:NTE family protein n=1 Tax=Neolewinella antarctica TaxID=442734 RepID=A0ABX0XDP3_9BACT|nr:patatin-like phospholipase family protein [Neolewinella antarctica]NJC27429.1 NTE family protein [Neolewinella antarctica]